MDCTRCEAALPLKARFCPSCGGKAKSWEELMFDEPASWSPEHTDEPGERTPPPPRDNEELRARLIDCYLNFSISKELTEWLQDLGLPSTGTTQEKLACLRRHAGSLVLPAESFPRQTIYYLNKYDEDILSEIGQELGVDVAGPKDVLLTRIYREVGLREGWLQPLSEDARQIISETFIPILEAFDHKKDYYLDLWDELSDVLGKDPMRLHVPPAYGSAIIAVLIPGFFQEAQMTLLQNELEERIGKRFSQPTVEVVEPVTGQS
ncbi:MAG: zinc ribbon domain-containing protein [Nitrospirota bacterium]|nr:zinc ribbon domain-containing protein [Nitrospirota bacterium]